MSEPLSETWDDRLRAVASELSYPPTPDISTPVGQRLSGKRSARDPFWRNSAWFAAAAIGLFLAVAMLVPPVRAAVLEFLQIGVVRIFLAEPTATLTPTTTVTTPTSAQFPTSGQTSPPLDLAMLSELGGQTSLAQANQDLHFPILLPSYPWDLGRPDHVYLQEQGGEMLILVWSDSANTDRAKLSLQAIGPGSWAVTKMEPVVVEQTLVNGEEAYWVMGPYPLRLTNGDLGFYRLVQGNVLIWEQDGITYRLESGLTMDDAIRIAQSLRPLTGPSLTP